MKISQFPSGGTAQGSDLVPIVRAGNDYTLTVNNLLTTAIYQPGDVRNYGAVQGVDCTTAVTAAAAANFNVIFPTGAWVITSLPTIPTGVNITAEPGATFSGAGAGLLGLSTSASIVSNQISDYAPPVAGELATLNIFRNPHYTGGPAGVNAGLRVQTNVGANVTNFEWAILGIVNNSAAVGAGQNVGVYGQGNKGTAGVRGGPTWGGAFEAHDRSGLADPTDGLVGLEVDCFADGTDNTGTGRRLGLDVVVGTGVSSKCFARYGIRVGPFNNDNTQGEFAHGLYLQNGFTTALIKYVSVNATPAGIDFSGGNISGPYMRMAQNQYISFDASDNTRLRWDTAGLALSGNAGANLIARINTDTGILNLGVNVPYGSSDAIITQTQLTGAATLNYSHRAQDTQRGTAVSGGLFCNHTILTNITVANYRGVEVGTPTLQAGALITNCVGLYVNDLTSGGTLNVGIQLQISSGTGKWNLYGPGTAINHLQGSLLIGSQTDNGVDKLQVTGSVLSTTSVKSNAIMSSALTVGVPANGSTACGILVSNVANMGLFFGSGAPTFSAAQGAIYSNVSGGVGARLYVNTNGATTWAAAASP